MGLGQLLGRGINDVIHPFGVGAPARAPQVRTAPPAPIRTPAPLQAAPHAAVIQTPAPGILHGISNFGGNLVHDAAAASRDVGGAVAAGNRALTTAGLGVQRSGIGAAQGVSGLADLLSPGKGTSRISNALQHAAVATDRQAKAAPFPALYKAGQALGTGAQFAVGGELSDGVKGILKAAPLADKVGLGASKLVSPLGRPVIAAADKLASFGPAGRVAAAGTRGLIDSRNIASNAIQTALQTGANASKGRKTTPLNVAANLGQGTALSVLNPASGQLLKEGSSALKNTLKPVLADEGPATAKAAAYFANDQKATTDYQAHVMKEFGTKTPNVVSGDSAKFIVDGGDKMVAANSGAYHEPASAFAKQYYQKLLADPTTKDKPVLITAGGAGAGKTSGLSLLQKQDGKSLDDYAAVNDTNLTDMKAATSRIDPALASGRQVQIAYVYRDPVEAFKNGNLTRADRTGRIVPIAAHANTHVGSLKTIQQVAEKYKDNPNVQINVIDNSRGAGKQAISSLDFLKDKGYNESNLKKALTNELEQAKSNGTIKPETYDAFKQLGADQTVPGLADRPSNGQQLASQDNPNPAVARQSNPEDKPVAINELLQNKVSQLKARAATADTPPAETSKLLPGQKASRHANVTIPNTSDDIVPENVRQLVADKNVSYEGKSTKAGQDTATALVDSRGLDAAHAEVTKALNKPLGTANRQDIYNAHEVAKRLQEDGTTQGAQDAADIYGKISEQHTAAGQQIQAGAALAKISPEGLHASAIKTITNGGKDGTRQKITADVAKQVSDQVDRIKDTAEGSDERNDEVQKLQKIVNQNVHHSTSSKVLGIWRTGLLTGPQTITKVAASHAIMAGAEKVKDIPAVAIDKTISGVSQLLGKGVRRSTALTGQGLANGFATGTKAAGKLLRTGLDTKGTGGGSDTLVGELAKPSVDYGKSALGKVGNFYVQKVGQIHASIPKGFFSAAQANDLFKQAIAEGKNLGYKGDALQEHVDNFTKGAGDFAKQEAQLSAQRATFQQDTKLGHVGQALQHVPGGHVVLPFAKIASTILSDAADYSPVGAIKTGWNAFKESKGSEGWTPTVQKHFVEGLGRSITGTGAVYAGAELYKHGVMTLGYPTSKPQQQLWALEGKQPNSIKLFGKYRDTSSLGPFGTLLFMGGSFAQAGETNGKGKSQLGAAASGALQNITSQSYLSGLTSAANAVSQPSEFAGTEEKQLAGSVVPIAVATTARATDPLQRSDPGVVQAVESKLPGARESLQPSQNVFGQNLQRQGGTVTNLLDPTRPSGNVSTPVVNELQHLENSTGTTSLPAPVKSINALNPSGKKTVVPLNAQQQHDFNTAAGNQVLNSDKSLIGDPRYNQLTDDNKVSALNSAKTDIEDKAKANTVSAIAPSDKVKLTNAQANGETPDYLQSKINEQSGGTAGTNINTSLDATTKSTLNRYNSMNATQRTKLSYGQSNWDYQYAAAKFANDQANGTLSKAATIKDQAAVNKAAVGQNYSRDVRDLYGLSKTQINDFITTDPNGAKYAKQLQSYDQALLDAGIISTAKFKDGFAPASSSSSSSTSLPSAISYKSTAPKTSYGKFTIGKSASTGSKIKLASYSTGNAKVGKLPGSPKSSTVKLASAPKLPKTIQPAKVTKKKGIAI